MKGLRKAQGEHNVGSSRLDLEVMWMTLGTRLNEGRKRNRAAHKGALSSKSSAKTARAATLPLLFSWPMML